LFDKYAKMLHEFSIKNEQLKTSITEKNIEIQKIREQSAEYRDECLKEFTLKSFLNIQIKNTSNFTLGELSEQAEETEFPAAIIILGI
jgi:hypothetical protein